MQVVSLKMSLTACPIRMACCRDSGILFLLWLSTATVNGAVLREVHPANCTDPLGAQRAKMPQCHNRMLSGGLNYSFCARIMPVAADGGQVMALFAGGARCFVSGWG